MLVGHLNFVGENGRDTLYVVVGFLWVWIRVNLNVDINLMKADYVVLTE